MMLDFLIEAPFNLGLKKILPGIEPGVRFLPDALDALGFGKRLGVKQVVRINAPAYRSSIDSESGILNSKEVKAYNEELLRVVYTQIKNGNKLLVIGGDCSILIGITAGLKKTGKYGLFFMDGHTDFVTVEQSATKAAAGLDLAIVAGLGHDSLTDIDGLKPYMKEKHIYCFGNREYDDDYESTVIKSKINYYPLFKIRQTGISTITKSFLDLMSLEEMDGFWLHLDADVLNDNLMPCVDSRTPGGLSYQELKKTIIPLISSTLFRGLSITIADPTMDTNHTVVKEFAEELVAILLR